MSETYTISELSQLLNLTARSLRFYESKGLVSPQRIGNRRLYSNRDRLRLALVIEGKNVGFSLAEIKEMLDLYDVVDGTQTQLQVSSNKFREQIVKLEVQKKHIEKAIKNLTELCDEVDKVIDGKRENTNLAQLVFEKEVQD